MPSVHSVPSRRSRRLSQEAISHADDDEWESPGELLYPDSDTETSSSNLESTHPPVRSAPAVPRRTSHARQRPEHHIPRPPNSFICFRTDYCVLNKQLDSDAVRDHRVVSQLAGKAWKALLPADRKYYEDMAKQKKKEHAEMYPDYAYAPASRPIVKGKKRKADDDCDYEERLPQLKRRRGRGQTPSLSVVVDSTGSGSSPLSTDTPYCLPPTARSCVPIPEFASSSQTPELSPNSSSESPNTEPSLRTPAMAFPQTFDDDREDFVPTSDIPHLDLYAGASVPKKDINPGAVLESHSQCFKPEVPKQMREVFLCYSSDGTYTVPAAPAHPDETYVCAINYDEVQFTNPFEPSSNFGMEMEELFHMDRYIRPDM
ncbi:hypothetical protein C8R47DRAFT_1211147 [Mycena vitilis]|nr:hypothetical protein C8R47DRAFT_1211147 [Mycena vitilis]